MQQRPIQASTCSCHFARSLAGPLGLIWIDAHMDAHVPATSPSGLVHRIPLAALLGFGDQRITSIASRGAALAGPHVTLIGVRSHEPEEAALLARPGVRVITMEDLRFDSIEAVIDLALARATSGTAGFGVTIDLDAFDPAFAPGAGSPVSGGLSPKSVLRALRRLSIHPELLGVEIAEFNPVHDSGGRTADLAIDLIDNLVGGGRP